MAGSRPRVKVASRSGGQSACAMAAYRSGEKIRDDLYQKVHDYARKDRILHTEIMAPEHAPAWVHDREQLWNAVEASELTKGGEAKKAAQLAREIMVPLPHELDLETNKEALREWIDKSFVQAGMIADIAIHAPDRDSDSRNIHAHVMLTVREITPEGFHQKKATPTARSWNDTAFMVEAIASWERIQNRELERAGIEARADFRSFEDRGIEAEPQQHEGPTVTNMRRKDKAQQSRVARENDERKARNSAHWKALHAVAAAREERARQSEKLRTWTSEKAAELDSAQRQGLIDLDRRQTLAALDHEERLQGFYSPQLLPIKHEAERLRQVVDGRGFMAAVRRLWQGRQDRERLEALEATLANTRQRIAEARRKMEMEHAQEIRRVVNLQLERKQQQAQGFARMEAEKLAAIEAKERAAMAKAEATRSPKADLEAELNKVMTSREAWRQAEKAKLAERLEQQAEAAKGMDKGKDIDFDR